MAKKKLREVRYPIAIATADNHLQRSAWARRPGLEGDSYYSFEQIVGHAIRENLPIICAGDLMDEEKNESNAADFLRKQFGKLAKAGVRFFFIKGNHDKRDPPWPVSVSAWPVWLESLRSPDSHRVGSGIQVYGLDWRPQEKLVEGWAQVRGYRPTRDSILVLHQLVQEYMGGITECEMSLAQLPDFAVCVMGDYHVYDVRSVVNNKGGTTLVVSPGSTAMQSIDEDPRKSFSVLYSDFTEQRVMLNTRGFHEPAPLFLEENLQDFLERLPKQLNMLAKIAEVYPEHIRKPILRVAFNPDIERAYARILAAVDDRAFVFPELLACAEESAQLSDEKQGSDAVEQLSLGEGLKEEVPDTSSELYRDCKRLLDCTEPLSELQAMRTEAGLE